MNYKKAKSLTPDVVVDLLLEGDKLPVGAVFSNFEGYTVQELVIEKKVTLFRRARYKLPSGEYITAPLPDTVKGHFGDGLKGYIVNQYHCNNVTQNKIHKDLISHGISISEGTIDAILVEATTKLEPEHDEILEVAKQVSRTIGTDDTEGKHNGSRHFHTVIQNDLFTYIQGSPTKSRKNFLHMLQGKTKCYLINENAIAYLKKCSVHEPMIAKIEVHLGKECATEAEWHQFLESIEINPCTAGKKILLALDEAALLGGLIKQGLRPDLVLLSDGAPQFKKLTIHGLCWIHAERIIKRLVSCNDDERKELDHVLDKIWDFYRALKAYKEHPDAAQKPVLEKQFDDIFLQSVVNPKLIVALSGFYKLKKELLRVLDYPFIELHNNSSERDIRPLVCKRKISGSTRSVIGYMARNIFPSIIKTCQKNDISPLKFIRDRLSTNPVMQSLGSVIRARANLIDVPAP